ncbi:MAG: serine protease [Planctomycetaceae bacterium]|nr:serine protease [Planctomycetaceae bacterium]
MWICSSFNVFKSGSRVLNAIAMTLLIALPAFAQSTDDTIQAVQPKMVKIFGAGGVKNLHPYSTGFLASPQGHVVTVWSHVLDADEVTCVLDNGRKFQAKVLGAEPTMDLAVLKLEGDDLNLPYFELDDAGTAAPGARVLGFSNMFKVATGDEPCSVLHGVIAAKTKLTARRGAFEVPYDGPVYIVDAITNNPGSGGGVLTTRDGKLLGMIGRELRNSESNVWINYAMPISELRETIRQIIEGTFTAKEKSAEKENPRRYNPADFGVVLAPDVVFRTPAYINAVQPESPAAKAGLKPDDLVLFINDELVQSVKNLNSQFGFLEEGDTLKVIVRRGNKLLPFEMMVPKKAQKPKADVKDDDKDE